MKKSLKEIVNKILKYHKTAVVLLIVFIILVCGSYFILQKTDYLNVWKLASQMQKQKQVSIEDQKILTQLKKIIFLPGDNVVPTMAVITDVETLKKQQPSFFANAKNGDHVVIYPDTAIIFDANANKIIKVGPVVQTQTNQAGAVKK